MQLSAVPTGQQLARSRWGTHESGAAFDQKKKPYLSEEAREFIEQQTICVVGGPGPNHTLSGLILPGAPGFVRPADAHTCLVPIEPALLDAQLLWRIERDQAAGRQTQIALFFLCHTTRRRLCVHGRAELCSPSPAYDRIYICLHVTQSFFHCPRYIRTQIPGLTVGFGGRHWQADDLCTQDSLSAPVRAFLEERVLCYLCTISHTGECGLNHRGGRPGFIVALPPDKRTPRGLILLPDYAGNGAFEAIGNILETGRAALIVPSYADQLALILSGSARVIEPEHLLPDLQQRCPGAQRVLAIGVERIEGQTGDWQGPLAHERQRAALLRPQLASTHSENTCPL
ncbi:MAG TPA: pyridoxamine 5'-phosphate oxidase family protein [Ktedonobacteraceae bacterium]|nr:pyridoxamine 5'-phosphate oxidase family protein [Ktedonobacteraceae bacterium]